MSSPLNLAWVGVAHIHTPGFSGDVLKRGHKCAGRGSVGFIPYIDCSKISEKVLSREHWNSGHEKGLDFGSSKGDYLEAGL